MTSRRSLHNVFRRSGAWSLIVVCLLTVGCAKEYDMERAEPQRGTLGEELHRIWVKDTERSSTDPQERTELLLDNERRFVDAVDRTVPEDKIHELEAMLNSSLQLVEEKYIPALSRRMPVMFEEATGDPELMENLASRSVYRPGSYVAPAQRGAFVGDLVAYDPLPELITYIGDTMRDQDGIRIDQEVQEGGASGYSQLLRGLADLADRQQPDRGSDRLATTLRDVFIAPDNRYRLGEETDEKRLIALFDDRGVPVVARDEEGNLPSPFVDNNQDGRADVGDNGRFRLEDGRMLKIPALGVEPVEHSDLNRTPLGQVEYEPGKPAFRYVDIGDTSLPYLVRKTTELVEEEAIFDLLMLHRELLGPTEVLEDDRGTYQGYPEDHPIVDIIDALVGGFGFEGLPEAMEVASRYVSSEIDEIATLAYTFGDVGQQLVDYPHSDIYPNQTLLHDLFEVLRKIAANPELWADVMDALRDPVVERAGDAAATLLKYRDKEVVPVEYREDASEGATGEYDQCFYDCRAQHEIGTVERFECIRACPSDELFSSETNFDKPESRDNRSNFQRLFHLLRDTAGVEYKLEVQELEAPLPGVNEDLVPPILTLPGAAEAFIASIAGNVYMGDYISDEFDDSALGGLVELLALATGTDGDDTVAVMLSIASEMFGITLDEEPTPDQITRMFNQSNIETDFEDESVYIDVKDPECKDKYVMADHHADGLFAAEASGLIDTIHPIAEAFSDHGRSDLMAELFVVIHDHYSAYDDLYVDADGNPSEMKASNLRSVEAPLYDIFQQGDVFEALRRLALSTEGRTDSEGVSLDERLRQLVYEMLRNDEYTPRSEPQALELNDGRVVDDVSRLGVILDRVETLAERHEDDEEVRQRLSDAGEVVFDSLLSAEQLESGDYEFEEDAVVALISNLLTHLGERADEMRQRGELESWLKEDLPDGFANLYSSRGFYGGMRFARALHEDEEGREMIEGLPTYFSEDPNRTEHLALLGYTGIVTGYNLDGHAPMGRVALEGLDPDREWETGPHRELPTGTLLAIYLQRYPEVDRERYGLDILKRGTRGSEQHAPAWSTLLDLLVRYFSHRPASDQPMTRQSWEAVFDRIGGWIGDDVNGLERFYELVEYRGNVELEDME